MVFQESVAKVAIGFFSQIKIFENTAFGQVTEVPISKDLSHRPWDISDKNIKKDADSAEI